MLRMYDAGSNLLGAIKSIYIDSLACVRVKWGESERFRIMSPWLFNVYMDVVTKKVKMGMGRRGVRFL